MLARNVIIDVLDVSGGVAGASMILGGILIMVSAPSSDHRLVQVAVAAFLLVIGLVLTVRRQLKRVRTVVGVIFLLLILLSLMAAVLLPNVRRFG